MGSGWRDPRRLGKWRSCCPGACRLCRNEPLVPSTAAERLSVALADLPCEQEDPYPTRHLVRSGDTLSDIARHYGASVTAIKAVNGLASHLIHPELVLTIPPAGHDQP